MSDAKENTGERYMMVNMEYHEALKQQIADLVAVAQDLIDFENTALMDDRVPLELIEKAKQVVAQVEGDQS